MSSIRNWYKNRRRREQTIMVPSSFGNVEELKTARLYDDKERQLWRMIRHRLSHGVEYEKKVLVKNGDGSVKEDTVKDPSIGDEVMRHGYAESAAYGGWLGENAPIDLDSWEGFLRLRTALESAQQKYGSNDPYVQTLARWVRNSLDHLLPRTITRAQVDTDRVLLHQGMEGMFPNMSVNLPEGGSSKEEVEKLKEFQRIKDMMKKGENPEK